MKFIPIFPHMLADFSRPNALLIATSMDSTTISSYRKGVSNIAKPFVILDNGEFEGDKPLSFMETILLADVFFSATGKVELVIPDKMRDGIGTLERLNQFMREVEHAEKCGYLAKDMYQFMFVPQGETFQDWMLCLNRAIERYGDKIHTIGIPKWVVNDELFFSSVEEYIDVLPLPLKDSVQHKLAQVLPYYNKTEQQEIARKLVRLVIVWVVNEMVPRTYNYNYHLLGMTTLLELGITNRFDFTRLELFEIFRRIRTIDSSFPYVAAYDKLFLDTLIRKYPARVGFDPDTFADLLASAVIERPENQLRRAPDYFNITEYDDTQRAVANYIIDTFDHHLGKIK